MNKPRILLIPAREHTLKVFSAEHLRRLETKFTVDRNDTDQDLTHEEIKNRIVGCDAIVTGWGVSDRKSPSSRPQSTGALTSTIMDAADSLKIIAHAAGSVRKFLGDIWYNYIVPREICVFTATVEIGYNVAETAVGMMIMTAKNLLDYALYVRNTDGWRSPNILVDEQHLFGATVGIVGASDVARQVLRLLKPFRVKILLYDPYLKDQDAQDLNVEKVSLDNLFARADIISLHAPSIPETDQMIGVTQLGLMQDGAVLVNTARGSLIDHDALIKEASKGRIRIALDVTSPEPLPTDSPLRKMSNVIITPHLAGQGRYGHERIGAATLQALEEFFSGKQVSGAIDYSQWKKLA